MEEKGGEKGVVHPVVASWIEADSVQILLKMLKMASVLFVRNRFNSAAESSRKDLSELTVTAKMVLCPDCNKVMHTITTTSPPAI